MDMFHTAQGLHKCLRKDMVQGGAWRRSPTRSVELETSSRWIGPSNGLQSTVIHPDIEIELMTAGGGCSIGVGESPMFGVGN
jgi:hypothetical protein